MVSRNYRLLSSFITGFLLIILWATIFSIFIACCNKALAQAEVNFVNQKGLPAIGDTIPTRSFIARYSSGTGEAQILKIGYGFTLSGDSINPPASGSTPTIITPSTLTGQEFDYNPTGFGTADIIRISSDANCNSITSLDAQSDGEKKIFRNVGSYPVFFLGEHTWGTAANRIKTNRAVAVYPGEEATLTYDGTLSRWFVNKTTNDANPKDVKIFSSLYSSTASDYSELSTATSSGSIGNTASSANTFGGLTISTSTSSTGAAEIYHTAGTLSYFNKAFIYTQTNVNFPSLSDGTNTYTYEYRLTNAPGNTATGGNSSCGIRYTHGTNSGRFFGFTKNSGGSETTVDLGVTVTANKTYTLRIEFDIEGYAYWYIDGVAVGFGFSTPPSLATCTSSHVIVKSAGTTARTAILQSFLTGAIYP
ncbi:MAG: hypothetical protein WBO44_01925 [Saprospiraceae bacterium]